MPSSEQADPSDCGAGETKPDKLEQKGHQRHEICSVELPVSTGPSPSPPDAEKQHQAEHM